VEHWAVVGSSKDRPHALIASTRAINRRLDPKTEPRPRRIPDRPQLGVVQHRQHRIVPPPDGEDNVLEWRLDPASPHRVPEIQAHDQPIVILCSEGYTSSLAAAVLQDLGLHRATDLIGGFKAWEAGGLCGHGRSRALTGPALLGHLVAS